MESITLYRYIYIKNLKDLTNYSIRIHGIISGIIYFLALGVEILLIWYQDISPEWTDYGKFGYQ